MVQTVRNAPPTGARSHTPRRGAQDMSPREFFFIENPSNSNKQFFTMLMPCLFEGFLFWLRWDLAMLRATAHQFWGASQSSTQVKNNGRPAEIGRCSMNARPMASTHGSVERP